MLKRFRIVGLCLVAIFALSAVGASSAMAEHLEVGKCKSVAKTGKWEDSKCTKALAEGNFEWEALPAGAKVPFTSVSGEKKLYAGGTLKITCKKDKNVGELTGPTTDTVQVTFEECTAESGVATCKSIKPGAPAGGAGIIITNTLESKLSWLKRAAPMTVGLDLAPPSGTLFTEILCEALGGLIKENVKVGGSVIGEIIPLNTMTTKFELKFECVSGKQKYTKDENEPTDTLTVSLKGGAPVEGCEEEVTPDKIETTQTVEVWAAFP
jgi:hypothetical protein